MPSRGHLRPLARTSKWVPDRGVSGCDGRGRTLIPCSSDQAIDIVSWLSIHVPRMGNTSNYIWTAASSLDGINCDTGRYVRLAKHTIVCAALYTIRTYRQPSEPTTVRELLPTRRANVMRYNQRSYAPTSGYMNSVYQGHWSDTLGSVVEGASRALPGDSDSYMKQTPGGTTEPQRTNQKASIVLCHRSI